MTDSVILKPFPGAGKPLLAYTVCLAGEPPADLAKAVEKGIEK
jgi:hypothetical protein